MILLLIVAALQASGPISKFDARPPRDTFTSRRAAGEIERCLIDQKGFQPPMVYRQEDRPAERMLVWIGGLANSAVAGRVDLKSVDGGTEVRSWMDANFVKDCAA